MTTRTARPPKAPDALDPRVARMRRFNRFYTRHVGALDGAALYRPFSLTEARVLWELANRQSPTATEIGAHLHLDAGYLSRILRKLGKRGLLSRSTSTDDRRRSHLSLTKAGKEAFARLDSNSHAYARESLERLADGAQQRLVSRHLKFPTFRHLKFPTVS